MMGKPYVRNLFLRTTADADVAVIEGVMGMYDGASPDSSEGSTAELASVLGAPVLLVTDAEGMSRSLGAVVKGFAEFESCPRVAGVIANRVGSARHRAWLRETLSSAGLPLLIGAIPRGALPKLRSRHLGLVTANLQSRSEEVLAHLADACEQYVDVNTVLQIARSHPLLERTSQAERPPLRRNVQIGIARDKVFHFYYPDNLEELERHGAHLVPFSPLFDSELPGGLDALYFGGGYPEEDAEVLSSNRRMLVAIRQFVASGRPVYAECGGLMYLGKELETVTRKRFPLVGILPFATRMLPHLKSLGYVEVTLTQDSLWGRRGEKSLGHEFHYSEIVTAGPTDASWRQVYSVCRRHDLTPTAEGFQAGNVLASYIHLHFASRPEAVDCFLRRCEEKQ
jgi:cobyrinic acid a,c-diamide synthase